MASNSWNRATYVTSSCSFVGDGNLVVSPTMSLTYLDSVKKMPLLALPVRSPVVQLAGARILISPGSTLTAAQLASAGAITDVVAPSLLHTAGMPAAAKAFPAARLWGPRGVKKKQAGLTWHGILGEDAWPYDAELKAIPLKGLERTREFVFVHKATRSLIVTDLIFNMVHQRGLGARLLLGLFGSYQRFAISKALLLLANDRAALRASLAAIASEDFDTLVPSHGDVVASGGKARFVAAVRERKLD